MIRLLFISLLFYCVQTNAQPVIAKPVMGITTGAQPYLEYGFGFDRLGGAKITYLDTGVVVKIIDSTAVNYKVQLSKNHVAYLPKDNFIRDSSIRASSYYLTAGLLAIGDDKSDYLSIALDEKLPY